MIFYLHVPLLWFLIRPNSRFQTSVFALVLQSACVLESSRYFLIFMDYRKLILLYEINFKEQR